MEEWRIIEGWPEYEVSNLGRVRRGERLLKQRKMDSGYLYVTLLRPRRKDFRVHRLVTHAFIGPGPDGMVACHNNGVRDDNALDNSRYDTLAGNQADCYEHGTDRRGSKHGNSVLTEADVHWIRKMISSGFTNIYISELFGVTSANICHIKKGRAWTHVAEEVAST